MIGKINKSKILSKIINKYYLYDRKNNTHNKKISNMKNQILIINILSLISLIFYFEPSSAKAATKPQRKILAVRKNGASFETVLKNLKTSLNNYIINDYVIDQSTTYDAFSAKIKEENPELFILMDNKAVSFGIEWNSKEAKKIKGVSLLGLNLTKLLTGNKYISGISFETPAFTIVNQLRFISKNLPKKINMAVFYRASKFSEIINQAKEQLKLENTTIESFDVGDDPAQIKEVLTQKGNEIFKNKEKYNLVWVILDSEVMSPTLFREFWIPGARGAAMPFVTGVENLVSIDIDFATFAVMPSFTDLATQSAQQVRAILEDGQAPDKIGVEQPVGVDKIINTKISERLGLELDSSRFDDIKVLK